MTGKLAIFFIALIAHIPLVVSWLPGAPKHTGDEVLVITGILIITVFFMWILSRKG